MTSIQPKDVSFPPDIQLHIASFWDYNSLVNMSSVSKIWLQVIMTLNESRRNCLKGIIVGKEEWNENHQQKITIEPLFSPRIMQAIDSACIFSSCKLVRETHRLTLISHQMKISDFMEADNYHRPENENKSYWLLTTKYLIAHFDNNFEDSLNEFLLIGRESHVVYEPPSVNEACLSLRAHPYDEFYEFSDVDMDDETNCDNNYESDSNDNDDNIYEDAEKFGVICSNITHMNMENLEGGFYDRYDFSYVNLYDGKKGSNSLIKDDEIWFGDDQETTLGFIGARRFKPYDDNMQALTMAEGTDYDV